MKESVGQYEDERTHGTVSKAMETLSPTKPSDRACKPQGYGCLTERRHSSRLTHQVVTTTNVRRALRHDDEKHSDVDVTTLPMEVDEQKVKAEEDDNKTPIHHSPLFNSVKPVMNGYQVRVFHPHLPYFQCFLFYFTLHCICVIVQFV